MRTGAVVTISEYMNETVVHYGFEGKGGGGYWRIRESNRTLLSLRRRD